MLDLAELGNEALILEEAALVTLGIALVGVALRLPVGYASGNWRLLVVLLGIVMPLMWIVSGLVVYLILGLPFWVSVLIGASITPTDPVVASSIVAGGVAERNLPGALRCAISAESGFNDGLALPFVVLPVLVLTEPPGEVLGHWLTRTVLLEIVAGAALAALMGYAAGKTLRWAERKETMERTSLLTISLALSLTVLGVTELLHLNGSCGLRRGHCLQLCGLQRRQGEPGGDTGGHLTLLRPADLRAARYGAAVGEVAGSRSQRASARGGGAPAQRLPAVLALSPCSARCAPGAETYFS